MVHFIRILKPVDCSVEKYSYRLHSLGIVLTWTKLYSLLVLDHFDSILYTVIHVISCLHKCEIVPWAAKQVHGGIVPY